MRSSGTKSATRRWPAAHVTAYRRPAAGDEVCDLVIPRVFSISVTLEACASLVDEPASSRLREAVGELDQLVDELRSAAAAPGTKPASSP